MCGIAGVFGSCNPRVVDQMIDAQIHRGPDDRGIWSDPRVPAAIGHCRLSIIDLTPSGHQPMSYDDERLWITYNGEIYNFKELRAELEGQGHRFRSDSDTEVILAAYSEWGPNCVRRLRGMFAFALIDKHPKQGAPDLLIARDRLGIKPLVYMDNKSELWFASELRGLMASRQLNKIIDSESLLDYLAVGAVFQPRTILSGAKALPAGHMLEIRGAERKLIKYWDLHEATAGLRENLKKISFQEASARLRELLRNAARYNMVADVPVGAFLSGGIDSTAVVGLMGAVSGHRVQTFSVGFEDAYQALDERNYARIAADHLHCEHHEIVVTNREASDIFAKVVADIDQPSIDGTNTWIVSRAAGHAVKVAVSGLGGDELFAGYEHFRWLAEGASRLSNGFSWTYDAIEKLHRLRPNSISLRLLFKFATPAERLAMLRRILANYEFYNALRPEWRDSFRQRLISRHEKWLVVDADEIQQTSYAEVNGYLLSTLLRDGDVMSLAHGLEVRPMLLDHSLVEFAYALPAAHKLNGKASKRVFIDAVLEHLPAELQSRPKMGFELPFVGWMAGNLRDRLESLLNGKNALKIFQPSYLQGLYRALRQARPPRALWAWGILLGWLDENNIQVN